MSGEQKQFTACWVVTMTVILGIFVGGMWSDSWKSAAITTAAMQRGYEQVVVPGYSAPVWQKAKP